MRILVTGGAGFIGSHIVDALLAEGHAVTVLDDLSSGRRANVPSGATFVEGDVRDAGAVERLFGDFHPEVVSHHAAQTSVSVSTREPSRDAGVNVIGSLRILEACARHDVARLVFASTGGAIYGEVPEGQRAAVGWPERPMSPYGVAKLAVEGYLRCMAAERGLVHTILRYANVYGPRQDPHGEAGVVAVFSARLLCGDPLTLYAMRSEGDGGCVRDYVYVRDVVEVNARAVRGELEAPVVNVCSGVATTTFELAGHIAATAGVEARLEQAERRPGDLERSVLEPDQALLDGPPTPLEEGLRATVEWFRARPA